MTKSITIKRQKEILKASGVVTIGPKRDPWDRESPFKVIVERPLRGFKKVYEGDSRRGTSFIAELEIPVGATVVVGYPRDYKLRASKAKVLSIKTIKKTRSIKEAVASYNNSFSYHAGQIAVPNRFNKSFKQCASGIHFYLSRRQAERH